MEQLDKAYEKFLNWLLWIVLIASIGLARTDLVQQWANHVRFKILQSDAEHLIEFVIPIAVIGLGTKAFRKWLWKLWFPELHFGGRWIGVSEYGESIKVSPVTGSEIELADLQQRPPRNLVTVVTFEQDMSSARLIGGHAVYPTISGVRWHSTSLTIHQGDPMTIQMSYVLDESLKRSVNALECITVYPSQKKLPFYNFWHLQRRYPQMLLGRFEHAWNGETNFLHQGETYYARVSEEEFMRIRDLALSDDRSKKAVADMVNSLTALHDEEEISDTFKKLLSKCLEEPVVQ